MVVTALPTETGGTEITRFNALRHGVLSRYTVLPWEDPSEYGAIIAALVDSQSVLRGLWFLVLLRRQPRPRRTY